MENSSTIFLIDSNVLITPYKSYYPFDIAPCFWDQVKEKIETGSIALLDIVKEEIQKGNDDLSTWCSKLSAAELIDRRQPLIVENYAKVLQYIQVCGFYNSHALAGWADANIADPWLIATAMVTGYTIITFEVSAGGLSKKTPSSRCKIPDVCKHFDVKYDHLYSMMRELSINLH